MVYPFDNVFSANNSSCLNLTTEWSQGYFIGPGILGLVCSLLLVLIIVFEVIYICRNKTTFLQHLFLYFTITATLAEVPIVCYLGYTSELSEDSCIILNYFLGFLKYYTLFVELLVIGSISSTLLSKMYKYRVSRRSQDPGAEYMLCCCYYKKWREAFFCFMVLIATQILPIMLTIESILHRSSIFTDSSSIFTISFKIIFWLYHIVLTLDLKKSKTLQMKGPRDGQITKTHIH